MKNKIESLAYYPIYFVKVVAAVTHGYVTGFIKGWRSKA